MDNNIKILIIDDDFGIIYLLEKFLSKMNYDILKAANGQKGLEIYKNQKPDLALVDLNLPDIDGFEIINIIRQENNEFPIIIMSGEQTLDNVIKAIGIGAWDFLLKPFDDLQFVDYAIKRCIEKAWILNENKTYKNDLEKLVKQKTEELRKSQAKLKAALEATSDGIWEYDFQTKEFILSPRFFTMLGYQPNEMPPNLQTWLNLMHPKERDLNVNLFRKAHEKKVDKGEMTIRLRAKNGDYRWMHCKGKALTFDKEGKFIKIIGTNTDITEKIKLEERIKTSERMESLGRLAGGVAHDLNNILSGIACYPEIILMKIDENNPIREYVSKIYESAQRATEMVQDLLTFARQETVEYINFNLNSVIMEYFESAEYMQLSESNPTISFNKKIYKNDLNIYGSKLHIYKIIMNLIKNSFDAMIEGNGEITVETNLINLDDKIAQELNLSIGFHAAISVKDNGCGIKKEDLNKIFEPFYSKKDISKTSGTGLGLAIVWGTIKDHHGGIKVKSEEGEGTEFNIYLPISNNK